MEGYQGVPPPSVISRFWAPGWNSVQALNKFQSEVGGPLHGGDPGKRLIEPGKAQKTSYFQEVPPPVRLGRDEWLIVPIHHIFGSEELSIFSAAIAELSPEPYLALNPEDRARLELHEQEQIELTLGEVVLRLPGLLVPGLPRGVAGLPVGLPGMEVLPLPAAAAIRRLGF